jgi:DnaJ-class molecular chaperone
MQEQNFYTVLGVKKTATLKEIKSAYRILAKKHHPDTNLGNTQAEERFKDIQLAYTVLSDHHKRLTHDLKSESISRNFGEAYTTASFKSNHKSSKQTATDSHFSESMGDKKDGINFFPLFVSIVVALLFICFIMMYKV